MSIAELGQRIRTAREDAGLRVKDLAKHVKRESQTVYRWEWGHSEPTLKELESIALKCGVRLGWLVEGGQRKRLVKRGSR